MCWLFHKWSKWKDFEKFKPDWTIVSKYRTSEYCKFYELWQERECQICGKKESRKV